LKGYVTLVPTIKINEDKCKGCVLCVEVCPHGLVRQEKSINDQGYQYVVLDDPDGKCTGCTVCAIVCPDMCIEVYK
jgi:2-oxoglutarate ferredoxin oxidoreductase subunit delta